MSNKFERRLQGRRKAKRLIKIYQARDPEFDFGDMELRLRSTRKPCSCMLCGNRRKYEGATIKEKLLFEVK